jgi:hypothetical protein
MAHHPSPPPLRPRPSNLEELRALLRQGIKDPIPVLETRPSDVLIATFPKCGTTWVQQIVHGLRTRGSMDFEEISMVIPWIERSPLLGIDINAPQVAEPRAFKTHLPWDQVPKGGRYISVLRDPTDALLSFYHFMNGVMFERDSVDVEGFYAAMFARHPLYGTYWSHVRSWWEQRRRQDVQILCFEDMKRDHEGAVRRIAAFIGISADEELIALSTRQSTIEFMREHERHFDDAPTITAINRRDGLPPARTTKVRSGRVGDGASLPSSLRAELDEGWKREIEAPLGIRSYEELRARLAAGE